jgi:hypothetical protein
MLLQNENRVRENEDERPLTNLLKLKQYIFSLKILSFLFCCLGSF